MARASATGEKFTRMWSAAKDLVCLGVDRDTATVRAAVAASDAGPHAGGRLREGLVQFRHAPAKRRDHLRRGAHLEQAPPHVRDGVVEKLESPGDGCAGRHEGASSDAQRQRNRDNNGVLAPAARP